MSEDKTPKTTLTRRGFLKATAGVAGAAALTGAAGATLAGCATSAGDTPLGNTGEEQYFAGSCRGDCFQSCYLNYIVRNGHVVRTEAGSLPESQYDRICMKGLTLPERIYSPKRVRYPLKRVEGSNRGSGEFERISWDEAIEIISTKWKELIDTYGPASIGFSTLAGNAALTPLNMQKLSNAIGGTTIVSSTDIGYGFAAINTLGADFISNSNDISDYANARTIIFWGANITNSQIQQWHFCADAKENGATLICIDPNYTGTASKSDIHVPLHHCTDGILAMAMINIVLQNEWEDVEFIKRASVAPFLVKKSDGLFLRKSDLDPSIGVDSDDDDYMVWDGVQGKCAPCSTVSDPELYGSYAIEGHEVTTAFDLVVEAIKPYTPEVAAEKCGVPLELIEEITDIYVHNAPSTIYQCFGFDRYSSSYYNYVPISILAVITGNIGKSGASCGFYRPQAAVDRSCLMQPGMPGPSAAVSQVVLPDVFKSGKCGDVDVPLKSVIVWACNWLTSYAGRTDQLELLNSLDFVVVNELYMSETAQYADIVLPITEWCELNDVIGPSLLTPYQYVQEQAVEPLGESKSDFEVANLIGNAMGYGQWFSQTSEEFLEDLLTPEFYQKLRDEKAALVPWYTPGKPYIFAEGGVFPTAYGRAAIYLEKPSRVTAGDMPYTNDLQLDKMRQPHWEPPIEAWEENELAQKYPLVCFSEHSKWTTQSQYAFSEILGELRPYPQVYMSREDADERGISNDDVVRVYNDRGFVVLRAAINNGYRKGMCNIPHGWQEGQFIEGHGGDLISRKLDPNVTNGGFADVLVQIEKVGGDD